MTTKKPKKKNLQLKGLNVETLLIGTRKAAIEFGLTEAVPEEKKPKRVFRVESTFISK